MKRLTLGLVACVLTAAAAKADGITVTGPLGTLPVGTPASVNIITSITTTGGAFTTSVDITSGPDAGVTGAFGFTCGASLFPILCVDNVSFVYVNNGTPGLDTITATSGSLTGGGTVTFGSTTGAPEPGTLSLLAAALAGSLALRRRIAR